DADLLLGGGDVLMTESEHFAGPAAAFVKQGKEKAVPQPRAGIQDRLHLAGGQDPRQLPRGLQRDRPPAIRLVLADVMEKGLPASPSAGPPYGQQIADLGTIACLVGVERADGRELAVHRR